MSDRKIWTKAGRDESEADMEGGEGRSDWGGQEVGLKTIDQMDLEARRLSKCSITHPKMKPFGCPILLDREAFPPKRF